MKKLIVFLFIAVLLVSAVSAQTRNERQRELNTVTVDGTLKLEKGFIALESGDSVYYVPFLSRYAGFIDGIKEGAKVSIEGYAFRNFLCPLKLTVGGKSHELFSARPNSELKPRNSENPRLGLAPGFFGPRHFGYGHFAPGHFSPGFRNNFPNHNRFERPERPERLEREKRERPERPDRPEREKRERPERPERPRSNALLEESNIS